MNCTVQKIFIASGFLFLIIIIHYLLQNQTVYDATFNKISKNFELKGKDVVTTNKHFEYINNKNIVHWDAIIYMHIKDDLYLSSNMDSSVEFQDYIFASFPFFSMIWKVSMLPPLGICILNYIFYVLSLLILSSLFDQQSLSKQNKLLLFTLALATPAVMVFLIPYSEATFMLLVSIAIWGLFKAKYWIFFIFIYFAAMTRSAALIISAVFLATDFLYLIKHRSFKIFIVDFAKKLTPLLLGTLTVAFIQLAYESGTLLKFIEVQKYWGVELRVPNYLTEWSYLGYSMGITVLIVIIAPAITYIFYNTIKSFNVPKLDMKSMFKLKNTHLSDYLFHLSIIYLLGISFFILFFKGGNLYGLARYTIASPFFFIVVFLVYDKIKLIPNSYRFNLWGALGFSCYLFMGLADCDPEWNFFDLGFFLLFSLIGLIIFINEIPIKLYLGLVTIYLFFCALWASYMFNMYLSSTWICI